MIAEPVSGAGGVLIPPAGYYEAIQAVLDKYGIALWDDEVICGFGRLGTDFGANAMGMRPEMMVFAKALSSAYVPSALRLLVVISSRRLRAPHRIWVYSVMVTPTADIRWVVRRPQSAGNL